MKIHAFKVSTHVDSDSIETVLQAIKETINLRERIRTVSDQKYRIEAIDKDAEGVWLMDFVKFREGAGPGKTHPDRLTQGFQFGDSECFGEETAALYNPNNGHFLIQYNHSGARYTTISDYINNYCTVQLSDCKLLPVFDTETEEKYKKKSQFRKLEFTIAAKKMSKLDKQNKMGLSQVLDLGRSHGGEKISVTIMSGRSRNSVLSLQQVRNTINAIKGCMKADDSAVSKLEASGRDADGFPLEVLDFLGRRLGLEYDIEPGEDRRLAFNTRCSYLKSAHQEWKERLGD